MIYRFPKDTDRNINVFLRPMYTPLEDRNLIDFSLNAGLTMHEPIIGRDDDTAGLGMGYTHVSASASAYDQSSRLYNPGTVLADPQRRDVHRSDLSVSGDGVASDPARRAISCSTPAAGS